MPGGRIVLALDLATTSGWAVGAAGQLPRIGSWRLSDAIRPARYGALLDSLDDLRQVAGFDAVVCEAPLVSGDFRGADAARLALGLAAHVEFWCWDHGIAWREEHVGTARKAVLGRGTFGKGLAKAAVLDWCRREGLEPRDDNAADAALLWAHETGWHRQRALAVA